MEIHFRTGYRESPERCPNHVVSGGLQILIELESCNPADGLILRGARWHETKLPVGGTVQKASHGKYPGQCGMASTCGYLLQARVNIPVCQHIVNDLHPQKKTDEVGIVVFPAMNGP